MQFFTGIGNPAKAQAFLHKTNQCYGAGPFLVGDSYKFRLKFVRLNSFIEGTMSRDFRLFLGKKKLYLNRQKRFHFFSFFSKIFMKKGRKARVTVPSWAVNSQNYENLPPTQDLKARLRNTD